MRPKVMAFVMVYMLSLFIPAIEYSINPIQAESPTFSQEEKQVMAALKNLKNDKPVYSVTSVPDKKTNMPKKTFFQINEGRWITKNGEPFIWFIQVNENPVALTRSQVKEFLTTGHYKFEGKRTNQLKLPNPFKANTNWALTVQKASGAGRLSFYANQGARNAKHYMKAGFSPTGMMAIVALTSALEVGRQIKDDEKVDLTKVVKLIVSGSFIGGIVGAAMGGASGSFIAPALSMVPVVGGVLAALAPAIGTFAGAVFGSKVGEHKPILDTLKQMDWWSVAGQGIGMTIGGTLGSVLFPPFGTLIGGIIGSMVCEKVAKWLKKIVGKITSDTSDFVMDHLNDLGLTREHHGEVTIDEGGSPEESASLDDIDLHQVLILHSDSNSNSNSNTNTKGSDSGLTVKEVLRQAKDKENIASQTHIR